MSAVRNDSPNDFGLSDYKNNENSVCGRWRSDGYNI